MTRSTDTIAPDSPLLLTGHCLDVLRELPGASVDCCVTSPPYWGLRDYGTEPQVWGGRADCAHRWGAARIPAANGSAAMLGGSPKPHSATRHSRESAFCMSCDAWKGSLGLEPTPALYVEHIGEVFREVRRVLTKEGTLWLVLGDCFAGSWGNYGSKRRALGCGIPRPGRPDAAFLPPQAAAPGLKRKDLVGIPWQIAFALRDDGWYLRSDIVWNKPNAVPESVRDRPTRAHEFVFLLTKSARYYYDWKAIAEPLAQSSLRRLRQASFDEQTGGAKDYAAAAGGSPGRSARTAIVNLKGRALPEGGRTSYPATYRKNRRSVWTLPTHPYAGAHFATYPPELVRPCVLAGSPPDGVVLDPFAGAGTTGKVAREEGRRFIWIELNPAYVGLARERLGGLA